MSERFVSRKEVNDVLSEHGLNKRIIPDEFVDHEEEARKMEEALKSFGVQNVTAKEATFEKIDGSLILKRVVWGNSDPGNVVWGYTSTGQKVFSDQAKANIEDVLIDITRSFMAEFESHFGVENIKAVALEDYSPKKDALWVCTRFHVSFQSGYACTLTRFVECDEPPIQTMEDENRNLEALLSTSSNQEKRQRLGDKLALLYDVDVNVTVELGRTNMKIADVLELAKGSIIFLEKIVGEPLEIKVSDKVIAYGEVVMMDEQLGIRITEVVDPEDRFDLKRR